MAVDSEYTQPRVSCQCPHRQHAAAPKFRVRDSEREHAAVSDEHRPLWTQPEHILDREFRAALTSSMRLLFTGSERGNMLLQVARERAHLISSTGISV
jgi:hypothetical protein